MYSSPGGYAGTMWCGSGIGANPTFSGTLTQVGGNFSINGAASVTMGSASTLTFGSRSRISSPADGNILLQNNATTNMGLLQFGGTTSSFPALKPSGGRLLVRGADDVAFGVFQTGVLVVSGGLATATTSETQFGNGTATTVGAAGAASALPAAPLGYIIANVGLQANVKIPYYNT